MWVLKRKNSDAIFYIKINSENVVGRNVGNLVFPSDKSISRKHCTIFLTDDKVSIEDHDSKYGTYLDEGIESQSRICPRVPIPLNNNCRVMFGLLGNEWALTRQAFKTCVSTIKETDLSTIKVQLEEMSVAVSKEWSEECTHLTMPTITLTLKVVLALVQNKSIVVPEYWSECLKCYKANSPFPSAQSYVPEIKEPSISQQANFNTDEKRKLVFQNKLFIFMSRQQLKNYEDIVKSAGGQCKYLGEGNITHGQLSGAQSIVIEYAYGYKSSQESQVFQSKVDNITKYMASKQKRIIPEVEIGLAILYVSTEKYCNPSFNFASVILPSSGVVSVQKNEILAPETQDVTAPSPSLPAKFIDETLSSSNISDKLNATPLSVGKQTASKRAVSLSPSDPEPPAKKSNVSVKPETSKKTEEGNELFHFVQDDVSEKPKRHDKVELTLQSVRRKRKDIECSDATLFNFVPDKDSQSKKLKTQEVETKPLLNIGKNCKNKLNSADTPDCKEKTTVTQNSSIKSLSLSGLKYTCQKRLTNVIKEDGDGTLEVISKLKDLDILPAVVVACNNLAVKKDISQTTSFTSSTASDCKRNFKKFVKVKPQRICNRVVSTNMLTEFQPQSRNQIPEQFLALSSEDEDDDGLKSFASLSRPKVSRGGGRRL